MQTLLVAVFQVGKTNKHSAICLWLSPTAESKRRKKLELKFSTLSKTKKDCARELYYHAKRT